MELAGYMAALRRDGRRMAEAAEDTLDRQVPTCPAWTVADLVWHTADVHTFWRQIASRVIAEPDAYVEPVRPADGELVARFRTGVEETARELEALDPALPVWTWSRQQDVGFIQRRVAQETAVHCWDALHAAGREEPIDAALAVDGVDEFLDLFLPGRPSHLEGSGQTVHLHATDTDGEWVVRAGDGACQVKRTHGKGDAAVRAPASDLLLLLWRRRAPDQLEVHGDRAALDRFLARTDLD
ncbi:MAG: maleylpyruvate isomerase family mycothiol-dependent enzyme [Egibacteraceae bacterium]